MRIPMFFPKIPCLQGEPAPEMPGKSNMTPENFPPGEINDPQDVAERLNLFKNIALTNESLETLNRQITAYRSAVAKKSGKRDVAGPEAMRMATDGTVFNMDSLLIIKQIRDFCKTYGHNGSYDKKDEKAAVRPADFDALGLCVAMSMALQAVSRSQKIGMGELKEIVNCDANWADAPSAEYRRCLNGTYDWIEGRATSLPPNLQSFKVKDYAPGQQDFCVMDLSGSDLDWRGLD